MRLHAKYRAVLRPGRVVTELWVDLVQVLGSSLRSRTAVAVENVFLRKQPPFYPEQQVKPRRASNSLRLALVLLARCFAWRKALAIPPRTATPTGGSAAADRGDGAKQPDLERGANCRGSRPNGGTPCNKGPGEEEVGAPLQPWPTVCQPGAEDPQSVRRAAGSADPWHRLPKVFRVVERPNLGDLHHKWALKRAAT